MYVLIALERCGGARGMADYFPSFGGGGRQKAEVFGGGERPVESSGS